LIASAAGLCYAIEVTDLFLIRHARAVEQSPHDWERPLLPEGRKEARAVGAALKRAGVSFDALACSPLVRAVETATLIAVELGFEGGLVVDSSLAPDGVPSAMLSVAARLADERVALVGHEPSMGNFLSALVGRSGMTMVKAGVVRLAVSGPPVLGAAKLVWTISPRQLVPQKGG
jgi:phosphohistidine phosphatase